MSCATCATSPNPSGSRSAHARAPASAPPTPPPTAPRSSCAMPDADITRPGTLAARIRALGPWFHNLVLDGIETAPDHFLGDYPRQKFQRFAAALPADLRGKTVLDVGCNAGFYAFEMKRRGAARVVAIDSHPRYLA